MQHMGSNTDCITKAVFLSNAWLLFESNEIRMEKYVLP